MYFRIASNFFFALGLVLAVAAVAAYFWVPDAPGAVVEAPERSLTGLGVGEHEVRFELRNPTRHPVRIVGAQTC